MEKIENILYAIHIMHFESLEEQITLALKCLDIIIARTIHDQKFKMKLYFDLVQVIIKKKIYEEEENNLETGQNLTLNS